MANKKKDIDIKATKDGVKVKTKGKKAKTIRYSSKLFIAIAVVVLIVVVSVLVLYFGFPGVWNKILSFFRLGGVGGNPEGDLAVHFVDVGQGDCIIIQLPDGKNAIIDAGGNEQNKTNEKCEDRILQNINELKINTFDYMFLTHSDADHVDYMDIVLDKYDVKNIYRPAFNSKSEKITDSNEEFATIKTDTYDNFIKAVYHEVETISAKVELNIGKKEIVGEGYRFDIYGVEKEHYAKGEVDGNGFDAINNDALGKNRVSPMVLLSYNSEQAVRKIMFTGDAEGKGGNKGEDLFLETYKTEILALDIDLLKVGHHGSASSASDTFLQKLDPEYAVISVGTQGKHGHPTQACLDRLANYTDGKGQNGVEVYMTKDYGDIIFRVNKKGEMSFHTDIQKAA